MKQFILDVKMATSYAVHSSESPAIAATLKLTPELIERLCSPEPPAISISFPDGGAPEDDATLVVDVRLDINLGATIEQVIAKMQSSHLQVNPETTRTTRREWP